MHKEGANVGAALEEPARRALLRRTLEKKLGDGKGDFDAAFLLGELPKILNVDDKRVRMLLRELVGARKRMLLVQAVSQARQRRPGDAVTSMNNLLSAHRAQPDEGAAAGRPVQWGEREELKDLYALYCAKVGDDAKRGELAALFGLDADEAAEGAAGADRAFAALKREAEEDESFF